MAKKFFYNERNGSQKGPFTTDELHLLASRGSLKPKTLVFDTNGEACDAGDIIDFGAIRTSKNSPGATSGPTSPPWLPVMLRISLTTIFLVIAGYWLKESWTTSNQASEVAHLQLAAQYSSMALLASGFAVVSWFLARPQT